METVDPPTTTPPGDLPDLFEVDAAAAQLHVHPETVRQWCRKGTLGCYRVGKRLLISGDHIARFLAEHEA